MFLIDMFNKKTVMPEPATALSGRPDPIPTAETHFVNGRPLKGPYPPETETILKTFFEAHDPTQGMRQGNDIGTTYRSAIYTTTPEQRVIVERVRDGYQATLKASGHTSRVTTEIADAGPFYFAEEGHQQYLAKNPGGYCGLRGTGVACQIG